MGWWWPGVDAGGHVFQWMCWVLEWAVPKKIRELKAALAKAGFELLPRRGKGSHTVWQHPLLPGSLTLAGKDGDDANRYQEKDVRQALQQLDDLEQEGK